MSESISLLKKLTRTKTLEIGNGNSNLKKCLNVYKLTFMGIGSMVGSGIYFLVGSAAKFDAGLYSFA